MFRLNTKPSQLKIGYIWTNKLFFSQNTPLKASSIKDILNRLKPTELDGNSNFNFNSRSKNVDSSADSSVSLGSASQLTNVHIDSNNSKNVKKPMSNFAAALKKITDQDVQKRAEQNKNRDKRQGQRQYQGQKQRRDQKTSQKRQNQDQSNLERNNNSRLAENSRFNFKENSQPFQKEQSKPQFFNPSESKVDSQNRKPQRSFSFKPKTENNFAKRQPKFGLSSRGKNSNKRPRRPRFDKNTNKKTTSERKTSVFDKQYYFGSVSNKSQINTTPAFISLLNKSSMVPSYKKVSADLKLLGLNRERTLRITPFQFPKNFPREATSALFHNKTICYVQAQKIKDIIEKNI